MTRQSALTAITRTIRMLARPMDTMVRTGSRAGSSSAQAPGTTVGDIHMDADPDEVTPADLRDAAMSDMAMRDVVRWADTASQHAVR
jgi:hypothetical protein